MCPMLFFAKSLHSAFFSCSFFFFLLSWNKIGYLFNVTYWNRFCHYLKKWHSLIWFSTYEVFRETYNNWKGLDCTHVASVHREFVISNIKELSLYIEVLTYAYSVCLSSSFFQVLLIYIWKTFQISTIWYL